MNKELHAPITICGLAGVGKSTAINKIVAALGFKLHSSGGFMRATARERYPDEEEMVALARLEEYAKKDPSIDLAIDGKAIELAKQPHGKWILDSRLGWYFCPQAFKVILTCDTQERISRIAKRDKVEFSRALYDTQFRENAIRERYLRLYGISDFTNEKLFDMVANTTVADPDAVASQILTGYKTWHDRFNH
jgi:cytidylate kinase